jgi:hypothetical protein
MPDARRPASPRDVKFPPGSNDLTKEIPMRSSQFAIAPALYALSIHAASDSSPAFEFCRDGGFLGVGWGVTSEPLCWPTYEQKAIERYGAVPRAVREIHDLPEGSLIWTRDSAHRTYYLAKVTGPWRYLRSCGAQECDIQNVRSVRIVACPSVSQVPDAIAGRFAADDWTIQRIDDEAAARRSASLFAALAPDSGNGAPTLDRVLTGYLDDEDVENLVCVYLQNRLGYLLRSTSAGPGIATDEYVLRDADRHEALVWAKRGHSLVARDARTLPTDAVDQVFVFSPTDTYGPDPAPNVTEIDYEDMIRFIRTERWSLPQSVEYWVGDALDDDERRFAAPPRREVADCGVR